MAHTGSYAITILLQDHADIRRQSSSPIERNTPPVGLLGDLENGLELGSNDLRAFARLALLKGFTDAKNHRQSSVDRSPGLLRHKFRGIAEESTALGMTWVPRRGTSKRWMQITFR